MSVNYTKLTSLQPFLLRAFYEWSTKQYLTAQILIFIDPNCFDLRIPKKYLEAKETNLVFNISPKSVNNLVINDKSVSFNGQFNQEDHFVYIPIHLVELIFLKENVHIGMAFDCNEEFEDSPFDSDNMKGENEFLHLELFDFAADSKMELNFKDFEEDFPLIKGHQKDNLKGDTFSLNHFKLLKPVDQENIQFTLV